MAANPLFLAMIHWSDIDQMLHVPEHTLNVRQLLVAHHLLFGREIQVARTDQEGTVELLFLADLHAINVHLTGLALLDILAEQCMAAQFGLSDDVIALELVPFGLIRVPDEDEAATGGAVSASNSRLLISRSFFSFLNFPF